MRTRHAPVETKALRLASEGFNVPRHRVVGFIAVHIHQQTTLSRNLTQPLNRARPIRHGALEMRNAANDIDAFIERFEQQCFGLGVSIKAILRECNELYIHKWTQFTADL